MALRSGQLELSSFSWGRNFKNKFTLGGMQNGIVARKCRGGLITISQDTAKDTGAELGQDPGVTGMHLFFVPVHRNPTESGPEVASAGRPEGMALDMMFQIDRGSTIMSPEGF